MRPELKNDAAWIELCKRNIKLQHLTGYTILSKVKSWLHHLKKKTWNNVFKRQAHNF